MAHCAVHLHKRHLLRGGGGVGEATHGIPHARKLLQHKVLQLLLRLRLLRLLLRLLQVLQLLLLLLLLLLRLLLLGVESLLGAK